MPIVVVRHKPERLLDEIEKALSKNHGSVDQIRLFGEVLQRLVSAALHAPPDGELRPDHIEVFFQAIGPHDITLTDVFLDIEAMNYPARADNLDERVEWIIAALNELFTSLFVSVWVKPVEAVYGSDIEDSPTTADFDMSMEAALERCRKLLEV